MAAKAAGNQASAALLNWQENKGGFSPFLVWPRWPVLARAGPCWPAVFQIARKTAMGRRLREAGGSDGEKNCDAAFGVAITEVTVVSYVTKLDSVGLCITPLSLTW